MTKEEKKENLKKISTAIDGIEARLCEMSADVPEENEAEEFSIELAFYAISLLRTNMDAIERRTLKRG